ncbi:hypothetical protein NOK12_30800 [Nocardioides sp. OK12]|nr:hypothetical protein NOK12_30800 [Nocardioides sp. OK12]
MRPGRSRPRPGLARARGGPLVAVRAGLDDSLANDDLTDAALALVTGVITRMIDTQDPWPLEHAARVLERGWPSCDDQARWSRSCDDTI